MNFWLLIVWIFPGTLVWLAFKDALWFVGMMSIYAIWVGHLGALSAETPVENEGDINVQKADVDVHVEN